MATLEHWQLVQMVLFMSAVFSELLMVRSPKTLRVFHPMESLNNSLTSEQAQQIQYNQFQFAIQK
ncbi:MAG: hypothetical protein BHW65_05285 [Verrucomicrobia bacterium CAG:312_58_20]|nr:MAG: hypothetical protein BHW65_05285 [Verrucomicrobia bacterium CAG:312_58_20]